MDRKSIHNRRQVGYFRNALIYNSSAYSTVRFFLRVTKLLPSQMVPENWESFHTYT